MPFKIWVSTDRLILFQKKSSKCMKKIWETHIWLLIKLEKNVAKSQENAVI